MLDDKIGYAGIPKAKKDEIRAENGQNHEHENHKLRGNSWANKNHKHETQAQKRSSLSSLLGVRK